MSENVHNPAPKFEGSSASAPQQAISTRVKRPPIPSLDGVRAIAVLIVLVSHVGYGDIVPGGLGVTIFFFLSGYLITTLLIDEQDDWDTIDVSSFYLRRAYRLFPPLIVTLAIAYGLLALGRIGGGFSWSGLASQLFYFANYHAIFFDSGGSTPAGTGILWSLAVEEHFYIVYPVVMLLALRWVEDRRKIGYAFLALAGVALAWRFWLVAQPDFATLRTYYATDTRFDSILFGCVLALLWNPARSPEGVPEPSKNVNWYFVIGASVLLLASIAYRSDTYRETARYSIQGLSMLPLFYAAIRAPHVLPFRLLNLRFLSRLGVLSYGIYLVHFIVIEVLNTAGVDLPRPVRLVVVLAASIAIAEVLDRYVDAPFRRKRATLRPGFQK